MVSGTGEGETEGPGESEARDIDGSSDVRESEWSGGLEVLFHQAERFDQRNWIPQVQEEGHLTVSVPF